MGVLKGGAGGYGRWSKNVARRIDDNDERVKLEDALSEVKERWIQTIDDYRFPVVTLSDSTSAEAVCTIFEMLNRTGVKSHSLRVAYRPLLAEGSQPPTVVDERA